jgi:hypothetical protein
LHNAKLEWVDTLATHTLAYWAHLMNIPLDPYSQHFILFLTYEGTQVS